MNVLGGKYYVQLLAIHYACMQVQRTGSVQIADSASDKVKVTTLLATCKYHNLFLRNISLMNENVMKVRK